MSTQTVSTSGHVSARVAAIFIAFLLLIPAGHKLITYCSFRFLGVHAEGVVIHSSSGRDMGGRPLLQYHDQDGNLHEFKSKAKTHWFKRPVVGERMDIFIDRSDSSEALVNNYFFYVYFPLLLIIAGVFCLLRGILPNGRTGC